MNNPLPAAQPPNPTTLPSSPLLSRAAHIARVKATMLRAAEITLDNAGFTQVISPALTGMSGACGDPGTQMSVQMGEKHSFLSQTTQLHLEPLMRELGSVYSISRSFRAERRSDERHLHEFTLIEAEAASMTLEKIMPLMEQIVIAMLHSAAHEASRNLLALGAPLTEHIALKAPFPRMRYDDAIVALQRSGHFIEWGEDLSNKHELALTNMHAGPLFVTHYPAGTRFFTMKIARDDPRVVECCDLLLPGVGEVMGASETEHDHAVMQTRFNAAAGISQWVELGGIVDDYNWYLEMHRQQGLQQAGFGMGFERLVRYACNLRSIAEAA